MSDVGLTSGVHKPRSDNVPDDWKVVRLKDFCAFSQGGRLGLTKLDSYRSSGFPAFSAAGQDGFVEVAEFTNTDAVVLSAIGANCGRCFIAHGDWTLLANVQAIIPDKSSADARFLFYRVNRDDYWPRSGSAQPFIKPSDMKSCWVSLPPLAQQGLIADVLGTLDTAIRETEAIIAKLKAVKQGLLHDLLTRGIDANGELRPPQAEAPHLYKQSPLGWIPRGWTCHRLEAITATPICYGIVQVLGYVPDGVPVLAIRDLLGDFTSGIHRTARSIDAAYPRSRVKAGDVLVSIKGTIGRVGVVPPHYEGNISRDIGLLRPNESIRSGFMVHLLRSPIGQMTLSLAQVGTTRAELSIAPLKKLMFAIPPIAEQGRIEAVLATCDEKVTAESAQLRKLRLQKIGLMEDLLTGLVRVDTLRTPENG